MRLADALKLINRITPVEMGKFAKREVDKTPQYRWFSLARLRPIHDNGRQLCCWCNIQQVDHTLFKYCSTNCEETAKLLNNTSDAGMRMFLLIEKQGCACASCGIVLEDELTRRIVANSKANNVLVDHGVGKSRRVSYWQIGSTAGKIWNLDHIKPIMLGGHGTDLSNLQVLCVPCHKKKTAQESKLYGGNASDTR